jgi:hypothetical protein
MDRGAVRGKEKREAEEEEEKAASHRWLTLVLLWFTSFDEQSELKGHSTASGAGFMLGACLYRRCLVVSLRLYWRWRRRAMS